MQPPFVFQVKIGGLTHINMCFTLKKLEKQNKVKGKGVFNFLDEANKIATKEETNEFLKSMKHNEYNIIEKLKKTHVMTSLVSLILRFKP